MLLVTTCSIVAGLGGAVVDVDLAESQKRPVNPAGSSRRPCGSGLGRSRAGRGRSSWLR